MFCCEEIQKYNLNLWNEKGDILFVTPKDQMYHILENIISVIFILIEASKHTEMSYFDWKCQI